MTNTQGRPSIWGADDGAVIADAVRIFPHDRMIRFYDGPIGELDTIEHTELPFLLENLDAGPQVFYVDKKADDIHWLGLMGAGDLVAMVKHADNDGRSRAEFGLADKLRITVPGS